MGRNWESKRLAKIALKLGDRISAIKTIQFPDMRNVMHICGSNHAGNTGRGGDTLTRHEQSSEASAMRKAAVEK